jgi:peptide/nickel transport system substrate-binding protein
MTDHPTDSEYLRFSPSRRAFLRGAGAAVGLIGLPASALELLNACSGGQTTTSSATPARGGHVVQGIAQDATGLVPQFVADVASRNISNLMFEPLYREYADNAYVPIIAASQPAIGADSKTFTVKLRNDVRWSDGTPLTADDVLFTYRLMYEHAYDALNSIFRSTWLANVANVTAPDPYTIVLTTKTVYSSWHDLFYFQGILPKHVLGTLSAADLNTMPFRQAPTVTNGPFRFSRWDKGQQVVVERNPQYSRSPVYLDSYVFRVFASTTAIINALKTGEVDYGGVDFTEVAAMQQEPSVQIVTFPGNSYYFVAFQLDPSKPGSKLFSTREVRQAFAYALDRKKLVQAVLFGYGTVHDSVLPLTSWGYNPNVSPKYGYDPRKAEQLLDAAGWRRGSSGVREKDGAPLQFELLYPTGSATFDSIVQALQQQWKQVGIAMNLKGVNTTQVVQALTTTRDFDMAFTGIGLTADPASTFTTLFSQGAVKPGGLNVAHYTNPDVDSGTAEATSTLDQKKAKPVVDRLQNILAQDLPIIPLASPKVLGVLNKRVRNFVQHGSADPTSAWVTDRR